MNWRIAGPRLAERSPEDIAGIHDDDLVDMLEREAFNYFPETTLECGLVSDSTRPDSLISIAGVGLQLTTEVAAVARGWIERDDGLERALRISRLFAHGRQSSDPTAIGYRGFYYHFLDPTATKRAVRSELSSIDTALLVMGLLTARQYFDRDDERESELRELVDGIYRRIDWRWMLDGGPTVSHGWTPERGFLRTRWAGYTEALLIYVLAIGSPTFSISGDAYTASTREYRWKRIYDEELVYAGPMFVHQLPQCWLDLRGLQDRWLEPHGIDYFENSRRATQIQQQYAIRNPHGFRHYSQVHWGLTASDGPGPATRVVEGRNRRFWDYRARGAPFGPDDGTIAPWAVVTSLPFAPELVLPTVRAFLAHHIGEGRIDEWRTPYGFEATVNFTFREGERDYWRSPWNYALNQGPLVIMAENHRTGLIWRLMRECEYLRRGLIGAGFSGDWLG